MTDDPFKKDITENVLTIDDISPLIDPKATIQNKSAKGTETPPVPAAEQGDHPGIALLDIAIEESVRYCEKEGFPPPNLSIWQNFSRGFLNKSLWHYFPSGAEPESPAICALIGIAGLAVCYTPVIIAFYEKKQMENKNAEQKRIDKENQKTAQLRAARRARGEDPNTGQPINSPPPAYTKDEPEEPEQQGAQEESAPVEPVPPPVPEWVTTRAQPVPIIKRFPAPEPPAPGMG